MASDLSQLTALAERTGETFVGSVSSLGAHFEPFSELPPPRPEAPFLTEELLPSVLHPWIADAADRMQVPLEFIAVPALTAAASVVGRRVGIYPKANDDWLVVPNLWGAIIARPGMLKSPALGQALKPIRRLAAEAREEYQTRLQEEGVRLEALQARELAIKDLLRQAYKGKTPKGSPDDLQDSLRDVRDRIKALKESLVERRYIVNDTTTEKLGEILAANPDGVLLERDELAGWLRALEREDRKSDREFFLESWNGLNPYIYDRIGRGTVHLSALCLSIIGGIQPAKLSRFVSEALDGGNAADGLLQRFQMLVWPEGMADWRLVDRGPDRRAYERVLGVFSALDRCALNFGRDRAEGMPILRFAADAQALFNEWFTRLQARLNSPDILPFPAFESHLSKYRSLMPSLALLFHLVERVGAGDIGPVSLPATELAADWCDYLELHARKVYAAEIGTDLAVAHALAAKIRKGAILDGMAVRDTYRSGWSGVKTADAALEGLAVLQRHGWLRVVEVRPPTGRPSQVVRLNPARLEAR